MVVRSDLYDAVNDVGDRGTCDARPRRHGNLTVMSGETLLVSLNSSTRQ
jgi:hypothetical protein